MQRNVDRKLARGRILRASENCGGYPSEKIQALREENSAAQKNHQEAAKLYKPDMTVHTPDGRRGKVVFSNLRSGSVDVKLDRGPIRPYPAGDLIKL